MHADLRSDINHEFVKQAKLKCVDTQGKEVTFKCAFTPSLKLGDRGDSSWNALVRGCCIYEGQIERYSKEDLHKMIHGEDIDPHNPPLFVTKEPGRYNLPSKGKPFYFFWARVENKATNTKEEEIFDKIIERHELEKQVPVAHALEPEVELDTTEENDKDKPEITTNVLARSSTYERLNSSASNSSGSGINQQQPKETEVKVETTEVEELTGQVLGVHNQFECNEIKGYKVGERYRKKHFNYNPKTKTTATAIISKANRQWEPTTSNPTHEIG